MQWGNGLGEIYFLQLSSVKIAFGA